MGIYLIQNPDGTSRQLSVNGRDEWALNALRRAGARGCTPIDNPAPRWSGYVFNLRQMGFDIETVTERHQGPFPGCHARYVLHSTVLLIGGQDGKAA